MVFDLDQRTAALSVGEFSDFSLGPREALGGGGGLWRAQLGTHWHNELRTRATSEHASAVEFEIPIDGRIAHRGWTLSLTGRIDQVLRSAQGTVLREIKSVTRALPVDETELRRDYPEYFIQLATYAALARLGLSSLGANLGGLRADLIFVEVSSGLTQTVPLTPADESLFRTQLERIAVFLDLRLRARERLRCLRFRPAFAAPRAGQETTRADLTVLFERRPLVLFEAPTGFGKTGVLLEFALGQLRSGHFDRALYLTSKSTGQLQVVRTLTAMTASLGGIGPAAGLAAAEGGTDDNAARLHVAPSRPAEAPGVAYWQVRAKSEHCVNTTFHCVRDTCMYLAGAATRWPHSGLSRFYLDERHARDLDTLRGAGRDARICPYEITRAALGFNDVWIGDYNYVFAPRNRGVFFDQPGFTSARTLLLVDEAHNLPSRVADAYSHAFSAAQAFEVRDELHRIHAPVTLVTAWDHWTHFLHQLRACDSLPLVAEDDARHLLAQIAKSLPSVSIDYAALGPRAAETLWAVPTLLEDLAPEGARSATGLPRLWWSPRDGELLLTCLDAATAIGATLREFGGVVLASATLTPVDAFAAACGLSVESLASLPAPATSPAVPARLGTLNKRETQKLFRQLTSGAELLRVDEARDAAAPAYLKAHAPWREGAYDIAIDSRVDTSFQQRAQHTTTTAVTIAALSASAHFAHHPDRAAARSDQYSPAVAAFFPSYAYAETIARELGALAPQLRVALQPKGRDLAAQAAWLDESLLIADALFLVLGSSFAESVDTLGGRVSHAIVVGPALPEVNAVQRARAAELTSEGCSREAVFRRVYQVPGMTKVNQALGRLVRAPGQRARVLLHCRRFAESTYDSLLASEYRSAVRIVDDETLSEWLNRDAGF
jgi:Rad3-related DNA helicase